MKEGKIKEDLFGRLLGKENIVQPLLVDLAYQTGTGDDTKTFPTIYTALKNVKKGGVIKLAPGVYRENLEFKIGDIKIQANQPNSNVILINSSYPSIIINLANQKEVVQFESIKFAHSGSLNEGMVDNSKDFNYMDDQVNIFQTGENMNTIFYIFKGKVCIQECKFSLNVLKEENKSTITPCIVIQKQGQLFMTRCQLFGTSNQTQSTIGVLSKKGSAVIKESTFMYHRKSALYLSGIKDNSVTVSNCQIQKCFNGITVMGDFKGSFENNIIEECQNVGIKIGMCCRPRIAYNTIKKNLVGIDYVNSDPSITNNLITFNKKDGIVSRSKELIRCGGQIKFNTITENDQAGIRCLGSINQSFIFSNVTVSFNRKCGILVQGGANPHIFKNLIQKNLGQGILITEGSSAIIEKNEICNNIKSNIALGGKCSINTVIIQNKIHSSRCEGIFTIYGERFLIANNEIIKNNQGIVAITSVPCIQGNNISFNQANGILLVKDCRVIVEHNVIEKNNAAGIFLRDECSGTIRKNKFLFNKYELIIENSHPSLQNVHEENTYEGQLRIPQNYECLLF